MWGCSFEANRADRRGDSTLGGCATCADWNGCALEGIARRTALMQPSLLTLVVRQGGHSERPGEGMGGLLVAPGVFRAWQ